MSKKILKRSMALGALMAFVITGNAMAGEVSGKYLQLKGDNETVNSAQGINDSRPRVLGGWYNNPDKFEETKTTQFTVSGDEWHMAVGGHYADDYASAITSNLESTSMLIEGEDTYVYQVVGGSVASGSTNVDYKNTQSTNLTINGGTFGRYPSRTNLPEIMVVAGDLLKWRDDNKAANSIKSTIDTTNLTIKGGTFYSVIIGGSAAIEHYSNKSDQGIISASVTTANTTITGGTFNRPIVAGGLTWGNGETSTVGTANLTISGADKPLSFGNDADIFSGGAVSSLYNNGAEVTVSNSNVNIDNATVKDIYGYAMKWTLDDISEGSEVIEPATNSNIEGIWGVPNDHKDSFEPLMNKLVPTTHLTLTNVAAETVEIPQGTVTLKATADGKTSIQELKTSRDVAVSLVGSGDTNDALNGNADKFVDKFFVRSSTQTLDGTTTYMEAGKATGQVDIEVEHITEEDYKQGYAEEDEIGTFKVVKATEQVNTSNAGANDMAAIGLMSWRAETDDMNKRMGELRDANGEHGVWVRMVRGEDEYGSVKNQYNQYQIGYDEKLSVDKRWTVGAAISYTDAENSFAQGNGESTNKALSLYGSKLNNDGTYVDLIAKYARLENDFKIVGGMGDADYSTNGYSFSAEAGKRIAQGNGLWIEPQVQLTYGKVSAVDYVSKNGTNISQDSMESIIGRVGFRLGKDIKQGNVYARASYLYDFDGETETRVSAGNATRPFENDLGGGWWEVGVGANINLSDATYIYADVEKTFGGEVDTNWQWNLGVRYSF